MSSVLSDPRNEYDHPDVDPAWDDIPTGAAPQIAYLLGHLDADRVHRGLLRACLPGRKHRISATGTNKRGAQSTTRAESKRFHDSLKRLESRGMIHRSGEAFIDVLDPEKLRLSALDHDARMPLDGLRRALKWAKHGSTPLHEAEARQLQQLILMTEEA